MLPYILAFIAAISAGVSVVASLTALRSKRFLEKKSENLATIQDIRIIAFETEKGKNLATKDDIGQITKIVEEIKRDFEISKIQFSKLQEVRLIVIGEMYERINKLNMSLLDLTAPFVVAGQDTEEAEKQRVQEVSDAFGEYRDYFIYKKLYFDSNICDLLEQLKQEFMTVLLDRTEPMRSKNMGLTGTDLHPSYKKAYDSSDYLRKKIPPLLTALEKEFKRLLGVTNNEEIKPNGGLKY